MWEQTGLVPNIKKEIDYAEIFMIEHLIINNN